MNTLFVYAMILGGILKQNVKEAVRGFIEDEKGAVDIVAVVVLIGIVVLLAIIFKDAITDLITSILNTIKNNANKAVN